MKLTSNSQLSLVCCKIYDSSKMILILRRDNKPDMNYEFPNGTVIIDNALFVVM